jgi:hypothetical protein
VPLLLSRRIDVFVGVLGILWYARRCPDQVSIGAGQAWIPCDCFYPREHKLSLRHEEYPRAFLLYQIPLRCVSSLCKFYKLRIFVMTAVVHLVMYRMQPWALATLTIPVHFKRFI